MDRNALAELLQALESRRDAEERRREERYTALIERGKVECWDPRTRGRVGLLDCALSSVTQDTEVEGLPSVSALKFNGALHMAVGTSTGQILMYDLRSNRPLLVKDHHYGLPIKSIHFQDQLDLVLSADSKIIKMWNKDTGKIFSTLEPEHDINDVCLYPNSGLAHLIGSPLLRAYMHGFFMDIRLYHKVKTMANPFAYDEYRKDKIRQKIEETRAQRVQIKKLPKVNKQLAIKLIEEEEEADQQTLKKKKGKNLPNILSDDRFKVMFENPDYQVDEASEEFRLLNPIVSKVNEKRKKKLRKLECELAPEQNLKNKMTTSTKDLILKELEELLQEEYRRFTWKLRDVGLKEGYKHIPKSQLENAERIDVVDKMIDFYGDDYAVEVTAETLVATNKLDLADRLKRDVQKFALQRLKDDHKSFLKRKFECVSECIAKPGEQSLLNEVFTKVHMTEGEYGELNYKHEVREIEVASKKGRSHGQPINCNDIFIPSERSPRIRTVLTKGIAGIGKSFSVQKFILDWAAGNDSSGFDFIYIFPFRELNLIKKEISLVELVQLYYPHLKEWEDVSSADSKVLFIFDGLDESRLELDFASCMKLSDTKTATALDVLLVSLIKGDLLLSASLWITSRPAATSQIPSEHISRVTEIQGFEDQQKEEYFRKRFKDHTLTEKIISHMRTLRSLHVMCYVPAFCWIIATVLGHTLGENGNENIPRTLTEVYTHFLLVLLTLQNKKHENREELLKQNQEAILNLGKLAFRNLERNKLIFYEHDLRECGIDIRQSSVYSGVCREIFKEDPTFLKDTVYSFVHLTVQEYFAALYVCTSFQNKSLLKKLFFALCRHRLCDVYNNALSKASKSRNGHLDLFLRFLLGLGMEKNQKLLKGLLLKTEDNLTDIQKTTKYIKQLIKMNTSPERSLNLFHCLSELNDNSLVEEIKVSLTSGNLSRQKLSSSDYSALAYVLLMSEDELDTLDLSRHLLGDEALLRLMPAVRLHKRLILYYLQLRVRPVSVAVRAVPVIGCLLCAHWSWLEGCRLTGDCCEDLASALCTNQSTLRELQLRGNNLGESGMKLTAALKHPNCKLEKLGLERCGLTVDCCEDLASVLCANQSTLTELQLGGNNLGKSGMKLTAALKHPSCKLEKLGLGGCHLTGDCCEDLASALCINQSTLRELELRGNNLGKSGIKFTAALKHPNCKLEKLGSGKRIKKSFSVLAMESMEFRVQTLAQLIQTSTVDQLRDEIQKMKSEHKVLVSELRETIRELQHSDARSVHRELQGLREQLLLLHTPAEGQHNPLQHTAPATCTDTPPAPPSPDTSPAPPPPDTSPAPPPPDTSPAPPPPDTSPAPPPPDTSPAPPPPDTSPAPPPPDTSPAPPPPDTSPAPPPPDTSPAPPPPDTSPAPPPPDTSPAPPPPDTSPAPPPPDTSPAPPPPDTSPAPPPPDTSPAPPPPDTSPAPPPHTPHTPLLTHLTQTPRLSPLP
ncbi:UNVERIFIED_CONTAM: hypothetical protein FKN15_052004 [Acipenser sinensis]